MNPKLLTVCVVAMILVLMGSHGWSADQPELKNAMKAKLALTQSVLEGIALEDFDRIKKNAQNLAALSRADAWNVHKTVEYVKFSKDFQELADAMVTHAGAKKLEAVTLDYVQMTMLCVKCHTYTRNQGVAKLDKLNLPLVSLKANPAK